MEIRLANVKDVEKMVAFHSEQFKDYYLTQLGKEVLYNYYAAFVKSVKNKCFIVHKEDDIVGLGLFVEDFEEQMSSFYSQHKYLLAGRVILSLLKLNKVVWQGTFERLRNMFTISEIDPELPKLTLLALAVSEKCRSQGIGKTLLEHAENYYTKQGVDSYYLSVLSRNTKAIAFYEKNGFKQLKQKGQIYYMEKVIS